MEDIASHYADKLAQDVDHRHTLQNMMQGLRKTPLRLGTACSGTDGIIKWLAKFNGAMRSLGFLPMAACFFYFAFACEFDTEILKFHTDQFGSSVPLFTDICDLGNASGAFEHHSTSPMLVPWVALLIAGFSCKDVSVQNTHKRDRRDVIRTGKHSTGTTWHGILRYLANNRLWVCLAENVEGLWSQVGVMREQVEALGYKLHTLRLNAEDFCLPQKRPRIYFIIVHSSYDDFPLATIWQIVELLKTPPLDIHTILASSSAGLGDDAAASSCVGEFGSFGKGDSGSSTAQQRQHSRRKVGEKWFEQHRALFNQAGLPFVVPTDSELGSCASDGFLSLSLRERSIVQYWTLHGCSEGFLDVSESLERFQPIYEDGISCITTSAVHYNFYEEEKLGLPALWNLQGLDWNLWDNLHQYFNVLLKKLVGNSFSIPNMGAVVLALLLSLRWPPSEQEAFLWMTGGIPRDPSSPPVSSDEEADADMGEPGSLSGGVDADEDAHVVEFGCSGVGEFEVLADMGSLC
jgi:site-specific DNA-cytosine methylase